MSSSCVFLSWTAEIYSWTLTWLQNECEKRKEKLRQTITECHKVHVFAGLETRIIVSWIMCSVGNIVALIGV